MMSKIKPFIFLTVLIAVVALYAINEARAQLVPAVPPAERIVTLETNKGKLVIYAGYEIIDGVVGLNEDEFPRIVPCPDGSGDCAAWDILWDWTADRPSHVYMTVSSDVAIYSTGYPDTDIISNDANDVLEQRTLRFNSNDSTFEATIITSLSSPRIVTVGGEASKFEKYGLTLGPGADPVNTDVPWTRFDFDSIYELCVKKELNINQEIVWLGYKCFDPATQDCSDVLGEFKEVLSDEVPEYYEFLSGDGFNVKTPGTKGFNRGYIRNFCRDQSGEFASFMNFLGPSVAYADCTCPPGISFSSGRKNYCICF